MRRVYATTICVFVLMCGVLSAHHGYAGFFRDRTVVIEGTLESLHYANPHVVMRVRTADDTLYTVTWQAATWVAQVAGVTSRTFAAGDHLVISAAPPRDPASHDLAMVREVRRPSDGWQWHRQEPRTVLPATR